MPSELVTKREEFEAKQKKLATVFEQAGDPVDLSQVTEIDGTSIEKARKIRQMNEELASLGEEVDALVAVENAAKSTRERQEFIEQARKDGLQLHPGDRDRTEQQLARGKGIGDLFVESDAYKNFPGGKTDGPVARLDVNAKTLMETTAGWAPESIRSGRLVEYATRPIQVIDVVPGGTINQPSYVYMEETTFTNAAQETAEGGTYQEAALEYSERSKPARKISVWLPTTDEQLEDVAGLRSMLNQRLTFMLRQRADGQLLVGDGVSPNIEGVLNVSNIQSQDKGSDPVPDAIYKAMTKVRVTGRAEPSAVILHPNDWQNIRLLRTNEGIYIWGNPSEAGPERIWGKQIVQTDAETENTGLVGDFAQFSMLFELRGVEVQISNSHSDYFIKGKQAIRADFRVIFVVFRPEAFCEVTSI